LLWGEWPVPKLRLLRGAWVGMAPRALVRTGDAGLIFVSPLTRVQTQ